jgi:hypothetical protein
MHPKRTTMISKIRSRTSPSRYHRNIDVSGAVHDRGEKKKVIPAPETLTLWRMPKTLTNPLSLP